MIQRIQSLFLLLGAACYGVLFAVPLAKSDQADKAFFVDAQYDIQDHIILLIMTILGAVVLFAAIFLYKNRPLQRRLSYVGLIVGLLMLIVAYVLFSQQSDQLSESLVVSEQLGIFLPIVAIVFSILAARFIQKDEKLVKSMDRLR